MIGAVCSDRMRRRTETRHQRRSLLIELREHIKGVVHFTNKGATEVTSRTDELFCGGNGSDKQSLTLEVPLDIVCHFVKCVIFEMFDMQI